MNTPTNSEDARTDAPLQSTKDALRWLKSALACEAFQWDGDQYEYATAALEAALAEVESARKGAPAQAVVTDEQAVNAIECAIGVLQASGALAEARALRALITRSSTSVAPSVELEKESSAAPSEIDGAQQ